ncbi:HK97 family phage prohead protease [Vibrio alginolyticus]|uniref:HK97 family phage prohead protease n=1 Tax=Vibrio alginolyticus TaxID=663 RepID=UPI00215CB02B|nr:HK97 family phage prohead protease [Vibrio alginolyticus]MCR9513239.1 HK97 family phage prohead protease [Vibrio alginolyticus]
MLKKSKVKTLQFDVDELSNEGVISGVLNYFGNKDHAGDITLKGAFKHSIKVIEESGRHLVMLWQHDPEKPIGIWKNLRETSRGLEGEGHINLETELGREAYALAKQGALSGISIGYWVIDEEYDSKTKTNYLKELELRETSLVTFPCNELARIEEVKKMKLDEKGLPSDEELKSFLVSCGTSEELAMAIVAKYMPDYVSPEEEAQRKAEAKEEVKTTLESLCEKHGLSLKEALDAIEGVDEVRDSDVIAKEEQEDEEQEQKEEEPEEDAEEKSDSLDDFFTK